MTVCSIKDGLTGHLRLTAAEMAEIRAGSLKGSRIHSTHPPLWEDAKHVEIEIRSKANLKDLRCR